MRQMWKIAAVLVALVGCVGEPVPDGSQEAVMECRVVHSDPYTLDNARVEQDTLWLDVSYGGGCRNHVLYTCWTGFFENDDGAFNEANPPRVEVRVGHDADGDTCEAEESQTLGFSLAEVKRAYLDGREAPGNRLVLVLGGTTVQYPLD